MELGKLDTKTASNAGAEVQITDAAGQLTDIFITVVGIDSDEFRKAEKEMQNRRLKHAQRGGKKSITAEILEDEMIERLARCTTGWRGLTDNGKEVVFSYDKAKELYTDLPLLRDQVEEFIGDRENFLSS